MELIFLAFFSLFRTLIGKISGSIDIIFFNYQDDAIGNLLSSKPIYEFSVQSLLTFLVMFDALAMATFGTTIQVGQIIPENIVEISSGFDICF